MLVLMSIIYVRIIFRIYYFSSIYLLYIRIYAIVAKIIFRQ